MNQRPKVVTRQSLSENLVTCLKTGLFWYRARSCSTRELLRSTSPSFKFRIPTWLTGLTPPSGSNQNSWLKLVWSQLLPGICPSLPSDYTIWFSYSTFTWHLTLPNLRRHVKEFSIKMSSFRNFQNSWLFKSTTSGRLKTILKRYKPLSTWYWLSFLRKTKNLQILPQKL